LDIGLIAFSDTMSTSLLMFRPFSTGKSFSSLLHPFVLIIVILSNGHPPSQSSQMRLFETRFSTFCLFLSHSSIFPSIS
jgi:hypothetical protein